jgi:hypothetical protein
MVGVWLGLRLRLGWGEKKRLRDNREWESRNGRITVLSGSWS